MIVVAFDTNQRGAVDLGVENLGWLKVGRDKNESLQSETRGLCGDGVGQVAGRRAADRVEAEGLRIGQCDGDDAILEAERRHADGIVLDVEILRANAGAKPRRLHQRRQTRPGSAEHSCRKPAAARDSATCPAVPVEIASRVKRVRA